MAYRDSNSIRTQGISLVITSIVVLIAVAWMLMSFLGSALAEITECNPDSPMETCDDRDTRPTP
jgi:hypothetical protein